MTIFEFEGKSPVIDRVHDNGGPGDLAPQAPLQRIGQEKPSHAAATATLVHGQATQQRRRHDGISGQCPGHLVRRIFQLDPGCWRMKTLTLGMRKAYMISPPMNARYFLAASTMAALLSLRLDPRSPGSCSSTWGTGPTHSS